MEKTKNKKEYWFSPKMIWLNFKTIQWLPFKTQKDGTEGTLKKFSAVTGILFLSGILFALIDTVLSFAIAYGGFNV